MTQTVTVRNPVLRGMYPDPSWIWDGRRGEVVLVNSSFELVPGLPIHTSRDFAHWRHVSHAIDAAMAERLMLRYVKDSGGIYAPTLRLVHGRYVIVCTVARLDENAALAGGVSPEELDRYRRSEGNFVISAPSLEGPWEGPFWVEGAEGIDPDVFEDCDGRVYWTQTRPSVLPKWEGQTQVWTQEMNPLDWTLINRCDKEGPYGKTIIWDGYGVEAVWAEGPHLYRIGDYVYLLTAEGGTSFDHSSMIMRAAAPGSLHDSVLDWLSNSGDADSVRKRVRPNERSVIGENARLFHADKKNPFLTHRHLGCDERVQCIGHADLLHHPQAGWWAACLGIRETRGVHDDELVSYLGRETFITPVQWQHDPVSWRLEGRGERPGGEDDPGWPVIAFSCGRIPASIDVVVDSAGVAGLPRAASLHGESGRDLPHPVSPGEAIEPIGHNDVRLALVKTPFPMRCIRVDEQDFAVVAQPGTTLVLRQNSLNFMTVRARRESGSPSFLVDVCMGVDGERKMSTERVQAVDGCVGLRLHGTRVECFLLCADDDADPRGPAGHRVDGVFGDDALFSIIRSPNVPVRTVSGYDARFLSTQWAGGFVGCMVGAIGD